MMITDDTLIWFLLGDVALIYLAAFLVQWISDKVWFWYVDKVLEAARTRPAGHHRRVNRNAAEPTASGGLRRKGFPTPA